MYKRCNRHRISCANLPHAGCPLLRKNSTWIVPAAQPASFLSIFFFQQASPPLFYVDLYSMAYQYFRAMLLLLVGVVGWRKKISSRLSSICIDLWNRKYVLLPRASAAIACGLKQAAKSVWNIYVFVSIRTRLEPSVLYKYNILWPCN